jgi:hypothetical protein
MGGAVIWLVPIAVIVAALIGAGRHSRSTHRHDTEESTAPVSTMPPAVPEAPQVEGILTAQPRRRKRTAPPLPVLVPPPGSLEQLRRLGGGLWPATFSCNMHRQVWHSTHYGLTPDYDRHRLRTEVKFLDEIVTTLLDVRPSGGRFRVDDAGVWVPVVSRAGRECTKG